MSLLIPESPISGRAFRLEEKGESEESGKFCRLKAEISISPALSRSEERGKKEGRFDDCRCVVPLKLARELNRYIARPRRGTMKA